VVRVELALEVGEVAEGAVEALVVEVVGDRDVRVVRELQVAGEGAAAKCCSIPGSSSRSTS